MNKKWLARIRRARPRSCVAVNEFPEKENGIEAALQRKI